MPQQPYVTLAEPAEHNECIEGSDFLVYAAPVPSPQAALGHLAHCKQQHPNATHHCWAYQVGREYRFHDDGEPSATAGAPIWRAIEGQGLDRLVVVVVRYFGGVKLGTGGLARAYGGTAASCLRQAKRLEVRPTVQVLVQVPFDALGQLYHVLAQHELTPTQETYDAEGVQMTLPVEPQNVQALAQALQDASRGRSRVEEIEQVESEG